LNLSKFEIIGGLKIISK